MRIITAGTTRCCLLAAACVSVLTLACKAPAVGPGPASSARWPKEPTAYRGVAWGASPEAVNAKGISCSYPPAGTVPDYWICETETTVAGVQLNETWSFDKNRMVGVITKFESGGFDTLRGIFAERYGPATTTEDETFQTMMGMKAQNTRLTWRGDKVTIILSRFGDKITEGMLTAYTNDYMAKVMRDSEEAKKQGAQAF